MLTACFLECRITISLTKFTSTVFLFYILVFFPIVSVFKYVQNVQCTVVCLISGRGLKSIVSHFVVKRG